MLLGHPNTEPVRGALHRVAAPPRTSRAALLVACGVLLAVCAAASLAIGSRSVPPAEVVRAFTAYDGSDAHAIVRGLRAPRTALGLLAVGPLARAASRVVSPT